MLAAAHTDPSLLLVGAVMGAFVMGLIWLVVACSSYNIDGKHEKFSNGIKYTTKQAHRIMGVNGERVTKDGQWIHWINSLWRTWPDRYSGKVYYFFLVIDELNACQISPCSEEVAKEWICKNVNEDFARRLIHDWFASN